MRAARLGLQDAPVLLAAETNLRDILTTLEAEKPGLAVIDSIQTMWADNVESAPGSVAQVRAAAHELTTFAKRRGMSVILVGHVTKDGQIAGPRVVEHMVDTVLYFEGERGHQFRILRAVKNRFGPADEIGVFEMTGAGLAEVEPLGAVPVRTRHARGRIGGLRRHRGDAARALRDPGAGGPRPRGPGAAERRGLGRRAAQHDPRRARGALRHPLRRARRLSERRGGPRISEPAADLAVAAALLSSREDRALPAETVVFGEISLSGAVRPVGQTEQRLKEARKLGFTAALMPDDKKATPRRG
jgi:DNA repair protein RadA/Sms